MIQRLSNEEIKTGIKNLASREGKTLALFLSYLIEVERRDIFLEEGYSTVYDYCERGLGLCHGTSLKRVWVARAATKYPAILDFLARGKLHLTAMVWLVKHLTPENHLALLNEAVGKRETELKWWLSELFPEALPPDWELGKERLIPLDGKRGKFTLVVDEEFIQLLSRSKEIHKHEVPDGNALKILKKTLREDLKQHDPKEKIKRMRKPRDSKKDSRVIPRGIGYAALEKAQYQCHYLSPQGVRCSERGGLERDHVRSWANGGRSNDIANIQVLCFAHNRWKARLEFKRDYRRNPLPPPPS